MKPDYIFFTMSVLSDLFSTDKVELDDVNNIIPDLQLKIEKLKSDVVEYTEDVYLKYSDRPRKKKELLSDCVQIKEEIEELKIKGLNEMKTQLVKAAKDLKNDLLSLDHVDFTLYIVNIFLKLHQGLVDYENLLQDKNYLECMKLICKLEEIIVNIPIDERVSVIENLGIEDKKYMLMDKLKNIFNRNISITENQTGNNSFKIVKDLTEVQKALHGLFFSSSVAYPLHNIAKLIWNIFLIPVVDNIVKIQIKEDHHSHYMHITVIDSTRKSNYKEVFLNLHLILNFLKDNFCLYLNDNLTTLEYIGIYMRDNLSELIIKHCLEDTIPSTPEGLQHYKHVIADVKELEISLRNSQIFSENTTSILEYASNIDILFINKKCHEYMLVSKQIMKKDLHEMIEVGVPFNLDDPILNTLQDFSQCSVSKSVLELLDLMEKIMHQAITASEICAGRLFYILQNIAINYCTLVPEHHSKLLLTIPQQMALFHNNCLFIAYNLSRWNKRFCPNLPGLLNTSTFTQEIDELTNVAANMFTKFTGGQINQITEIMNNAGLDGSTLEDLPAITEKSIRQCLRQQELLKTVWHKVLSYTMYNTTLGAILNCLCLCIINSVIKFEYISLVAAEKLIEVLKIVMTRGPKLFTDPKEVILYVSSWYKLNELNFVLGASLIDINDRWADGKGPLALQFEPTEMKALIRAIFQNTDRRAAVLAKIQE